MFRIAIEHNKCRPPVRPSGGVTSPYFVCALSQQIVLQQGHPNFGTQANNIKITIIIIIRRIIIIIIKPPV